MFCRDRTIDYLRQYGYNVVRLPKGDLPPLQLLSGDKRELSRFGKLQTVLVGDGSVPLPRVGRDLPAPHISGQRTSELKVGLGLSVLGSLVGAMGGSILGLKGAYGEAATISFEFADVFEDKVEVAALDRYLAASDIDPLSKTAAQILERDEMYVVTSTLKSDKILVHSQRKRGGSVEIDVPVLQGAVGAKVRVSATSGATQMLTYIGAKPLVFGFQAVQMFYDFGTYRVIKTADDVVARDLADVPSDGAVRYVAATPLLRMDD
jgi:hypothetical protein